MNSMSLHEFETLQENFAQANIEAGVKPHYLDRAEAAREAIERGKKMTSPRAEARGITQSASSA